MPNTRAGARWPLSDCASVFRLARSCTQATAPTPEAHATRQNLILRVQQSIDKLGQPLKVSPFGSFVSGHYDAKSDLDLVRSQSKDLSLLDLMCQNLQQARAIATSFPPDPGSTARSCVKAQRTHICTSSKPPLHRSYRARCPLPVEGGARSRRMERLCRW